MLNLSMASVSHFMMAINLELESWRIQLSMGVVLAASLLKTLLLASSFLKVECQHLLD